MIGANLELGSGGGGISVADGFTLVWDSPITGDGDFTKEGNGTLDFPVTAAISYTGDTTVKAGKLDVSSTSPTSATCSGTGTSNLCGAPDPDQQSLVAVDSSGLEIVDADLTILPPNPKATSPPWYWNRRMALTRQSAQMPTRPLRLPHSQCLPIRPLIC